MHCLLQFLSDNNNLKSSKKKHRRNRYFDFKKAFAKVNHRQIIKKLSQLGFNSYYRIIKGSVMLQKST